jgi:hypothetical protein
MALPKLNAPILIEDARPGAQAAAHALLFGGERLPHRVRVFIDFMAPRLRGFLAAMD